MDEATATRPPQKWLNPPRPLDPGFSPWLRRTRESLGFSATEMAQRCGVNRTTYQSLEHNRGGTGSPLLLFEGLARGLGLDLGFVLHMAGVDIGQNGVNLERLDKMEDIAARLLGSEHLLRLAIAEAADRLGDPETVGLLRRALSELDLVTERMKEAR